MEPNKSLLERLKFDDGLHGPSRVRGGYEDALTQFLVFCASPVVPNLLVYDSSYPRSHWAGLGTGESRLCSHPYLISLGCPPTMTWNRGTM